MHKEQNSNRIIKLNSRDNLFHFWLNSLYHNFEVLQQRLKTFDQDQYLISIIQLS